MAKPKTQEQWVIERLNDTGSVTRNECLSRFPAITRLGAIICSLKQKGWNIEAGNHHNDYVYTLKSRPLKKSYEVVGDKVIMKMI